MIAISEFPADVEYDERGEGPALLLLPGSFGTGSGWRAVTDRLARRYRIVTTSLLGYGATAERRPLGNATMRQQTEVIDCILGRIGEPAHVVGHSFGGLVALAHAIEGAIKPASLLLVEANPLGLLKTSGEAELYAAFGAMTRDYFAEFESGRPDAARHVIDFYGGEEPLQRFPPKSVTTSSRRRPPTFATGHRELPSSRRFLPTTRSPQPRSLSAAAMATRR